MKRSLAPIIWPRFFRSVLALLANEDFLAVELKLLRQSDGLAAVVHEHLRSSLHGLDASLKRAVYISIRQAVILDLA